MVMENYTRLMYMYITRLCVVLYFFDNENVLIYKKQKTEVET